MNSNVKYKITALKEVVILAFVTKQIIDTSPGGNSFPRPIAELQWIPLHEGEIKDGVGMVYGVRPDCLPNMATKTLDGFCHVDTGTWHGADLPRDFFGLYRLAFSDSHE